MVHGLLPQDLPTFPATAHLPATQTALAHCGSTSPARTHVTPSASGTCSHNPFELQTPDVHTEVAVQDFPLTGLGTHSPTASPHTPE